MSLGSSLREARDGAGLTLDELASRTSIRVDVLKDFENDNFTKSGGEAYARGHLRILAKALNVASSTFLDAYDCEHVVKKRAMSEMLIENNVMAARADKPRISLKTLSIISATVVGVVALGQIVMTNTSSDKVSVLQTTAKPTSTPSAVASPSPSQTSDPTTPVTTGMQVQVSATRGNSWIFVTDPTGQTIFSGQLRKGMSNTFTSETTLSIRFGNAGGVDVTVNGVAVGSIGANGEVVDRTFGANSSL
ncbi:MAG: DUF4115 domain-containing protein [Streptomycetaceae bacterium]|nr:MAG: DUF4115 domain-containing protein [Streptomycetaceae bacterium]